MNKIKSLHERLDIFVKVLYIRAFVEWKDFKKYKQLYRKHILLMNWWVEDKKKSVNDFENSFQNLIKDIKKNNFNSNFPIPLFKDWDILNGAHRLACCIYFWITPSTIISKKHWHKTKWDLNWFIKNGFSQKEIINILREYYNYDEDISLIILWPSIIEKKEHVKKIISQHSINIYWSFTLWLKDRHTFREFIYDIYAYDWHFKESLWLDKKSLELSSKWTNIEVLIIKSSSKILEKQKIRSNILEYFPKIPSKYYTFHAWDRREEDIYLINIILNENNISNLYQRRNVEKSLSQKIDIIYTYIRKNNISTQDFCIVWSWPLWVFWIDKVSDIDIIFKNIKSSGIIKASKYIDILDYEYYKDISNKELIENPTYHFYFRGLKFLNLDILKVVKWDFWAREKDIIQSKRIENFLLSNSKINYKAKIILQYHFLKKILKVRLINTAIYITKKLCIYKPISYLWRKHILKRQREINH